MSATLGGIRLLPLAEKLTTEFGRGFSKSNLEYMRRFFLAYQDRLPIAQSETGQTLTVLRNEAEIAQLETGQLVVPASNARPFRLSWTHYVFLLGVKNPDERSFYEIESADQNWNSNASCSSGRRRRAVSSGKERTSETTGRITGPVAPRAKTPKKRERQWSRKLYRTSCVPLR